MNDVCKQIVLSSLICCDAINDIIYCADVMANTAHNVRQIIPHMGRPSFLKISCDVFTKMCNFPGAKVIMPSPSN